MCFSNVKPLGKISKIYKKIVINEKYPLPGVIVIAMLLYIHVVMLLNIITLFLFSGLKLQNPCRQLWLGLPSV